MLAATKLYENLLQCLKIAVLERVAPMEYQVIGSPPAFYIRMFPPANDGLPCAAPWIHSFMLKEFLEEAEDFFKAGETRALDTGLWIEDSLGAPEALQAMAIKIDDRKLMIIRSAQEDHTEKSHILNKARKNLIERRQMATELTFFKTKSSIDQLTTLFNRSAFIEYLDSFLNTSGKRQQNIGLLMFDIDNFKMINDKYGHVKGDEVLAELGALIKECIRENDMPVRYGGEEFCIFSQDITQDQEISFAEKLLSTISSHAFLPDGRVTVSIGITMHKPGDTTLALVERADHGLYEAKRNGKNQFFFCS